MMRRTSTTFGARRWIMHVIFIGACMGSIAAISTGGNLPGNTAEQEQVLRGRQLAIHHGCGDCHGGYDNPAAEGWLQGMRTPEQEFVIGPFKTRPRNLTPDNTTGIGKFSEQQIFNALRYGLRPGETPDVEITSATPGEGNFPANPKYLAPPMPWPSFRHMSDQELRDIAAYLKRGLKPVRHQVEDSEGPPDLLGERLHTRQDRKLSCARVPNGERSAEAVVSRPNKRHNGLAATTPDYSPAHGSGVALAGLCGEISCLGKRRRLDRFCRDPITLRLAHHGERISRRVTTAPNLFRGAPSKSSLLADIRHASYTRASPPRSGRIVGPS